MTKLLNWLMFGLSSSDIHGSTPHYDFDDSFFVISRNSFQAYTNQAGFMELSRLTTLVSNCNIFVLTKAEENDYERAEVLKVSKFYEMVHDKKVVGVPVRAISEQDYKYTKEFQIVESWPLIQAYGLDSRFNSVLCEINSFDFSGRKWVLHHAASIPLSAREPPEDLPGV